MAHLCFGTAAAKVIALPSAHFGAPVCERRNSSWPLNGPQTHRSHRATLHMKTDPPVTELLSSPDFVERVRGVNRVEQIEATADRVAALLPLATEDPNQQVRYAAISRLASLDHAAVDAEDGERILSAARFILVNDKESSCQAGAADVIAGLRLTDGFDDLVDAFERTTDWMLKFSIAAGLGEMGSPKAFDFLTGILDGKDQDFLLMAAAIGALGDLGDKRGIAVVEKYLENEDSSIRERATIARNILVGDAPAG